MKKSANKKGLERLAYLSHSKKQLFERDQDLFARVYFEGEEIVPTDKMIWGKELAENLEDGVEASEDALMAHALLYLPKYVQREVRMEVSFGGMKFVTQFDGYDPKECGIGEYKSGTTPWSQAMAQSNKQLKMYAMVFFFKKKKLPKWLRLHWFNTDTGEIKTFEVHYSKVDVLRYFGECKKTWIEIKKFIKNYEREHRTDVARARPGKRTSRKGSSGVGLHRKGI